MKLLIVLLTAIAACDAYVVQQPTITLLEPQGIRFAYPADPGVNLVAFHYNVNVQLVGVAVGQYNVDVTTPTNGYFVYDNTAVVVNPGDKVYYWINVIANGGGYNLENQVWTAESAEATTTTTTTTKATTTIKATTKAPAPETTAPPTDGGDAGGNTGGNTGGSTGGSTGGGPIIETGPCSRYPCDASCDMNTPPCNGLIFEENWDTLDKTRWQHEITMSGGGNWEFQFYTNNRSNSYVRDNTLFIKPTLTADHYGESLLSSGSLDLWGSSPADLCTANSFWGCQRTGSATNYLTPVQSARMRTAKSFAFKYGRIEVEAKLPEGDWLWPAIWLLPRDNRYGGWPASGEIDIMESRGNINLKDAQGVSKGNDNMGMTLHWGPYWPLNGYPKTTVESHPSSGTYASGFHKWVVDWTEDYIDLYVDGTLLRRVDPGPSGFFDYGNFGNDAPGIDNPWGESPNKMAPFDQEFYLVLNVAVGGTNGFFPDEWTNQPYPKPWLNTSPTAMKDFWLQKNNWYPTWQADVNNGENAAMQVKNIKVWAK